MHQDANEAILELHQFLIEKQETMWLISCHMDEAQMVKMNGKCSFTHPLLGGLPHVNHWAHA